MAKDRLGPIGRDIQARGLRVTTRMKAMTSGVDGGPQQRTGNLHASVAFLEYGVDSESLYAAIGLYQHRMYRRGWHYGILLEGPDSAGDPRIHLRGGHRFGVAARRPFLARSLLAAR